MTCPASFSTLQQWLAWLEHAHPVHDIELGLGRIGQVAKVLLQGRPIAKQVITVAGTNGKGSTIAYLSSILQTAGITFGALTSPHFVRFNERISFNGNTVSDADLCASFARVNKARVEAASEPVELTYFEFNALLAFDLMQQRQPDVALLEIGLGGRLDAVNIIDPDIAIVTSIAVDHVDWLGSDIDVIGREKAGIFRAHQPAIFGQVDGTDAVGAYANEIGAKWYQNGDQFCQQGQIWRSIDGTQLTLPEVKLPAQNVAAVVQAIKLLPMPISPQAIQKGLREARLTGRYQQLTWRNKRIILDVAHNPHAAANLGQELDTETMPVHGVFAILSDKDYAAIVEIMAQHLQHWYIAPTTGPRGLTTADLSQALDQAGVSQNRYHVCHSVKHALEQAAANANDADSILVFGSFHTVGDALAYFESQQET
ncbi:MAG: bifunctional tetrahydrofolate synthase/dihydrofolate synthase [Gammaproteobacteria bacterium]|nr:bifunctional tetrahydrofolate synthase/dihydrofolate synthase [Gammaproteobacteria bacterium]MCP4879330.1 bifunctional tetrahydrofolate synthase/dihydrofolate synthase [Gammaproteobacteria bacterium]